MEEKQFDLLLRALDRIATALETRAMFSQPGNGGHSSRPTHECNKLPDGRFQWVIPPGHKISKCKYCGGEIYWLRSKNHKNVPVNADGFGHRDTCQQSGNPATTTGGSKSGGPEAPPF